MIMDTFSNLKATVKKRVAWMILSIATSFCVVDLGGLYGAIMFLKKLHTP